MVGRDSVEPVWGARKSFAPRSPFRFGETVDARDPCHLPRRFVGSGVHGVHVAEGPAGRHLGHEPLCVVLSVLVALNIGVRDTAPDAFLI